jgi:hypothetical protein
MYGLKLTASRRTETERSRLQLRWPILFFLKKEPKTVALRGFNSEWVDGAIPIREVLYRLMSGRGIHIDWVAAKDILNKTRSEESRYEGLRQLIDKYPVVLHEWFLEMFPDPGLWLESRTKFARTTAVMSMVGYILGLGDRHYENLLLLENSGELMHVDFDCLFNKCLDLDTPERVPFRLTRSIVRAMGLSGLSYVPALPRNGATRVYRVAPNNLTQLAYDILFEHESNRLVLLGKRPSGSNLGEADLGGLGASPQ